MTEARVKLDDRLLAVVDALRGSRPRNRYLAEAVRMGVKAIHAQASKNAPLPAHDFRYLPLAQVKHEGEHHYFDYETIARIQALLDRLPY